MTEDSRSEPLARRQLMHRRQFLGLAGSLGLAAAARGSKSNDAFDPEAWLKKRKIGRLTTRTPQSGKPLQALAATTLDEWKAERALYEKALRELIGPWPDKRPGLEARTIEEKRFGKYTRRKVGFRSLPSKAAYASEIRAWLFVPRGPKPPRPAIIT